MSIRMMTALCVFGVDNWFDVIIVITLPIIRQNTPFGSRHVSIAPKHPPIQCESWIFLVFSQNLWDVHRSVQLLSHFIFCCVVVVVLVVLLCCCCSHTQTHTHMRNNTNTNNWNSKQHSKQPNWHSSVESQQSSVELVLRGNAAKICICCTDRHLLYLLRTIVRTPKSRPIQ